ncbi:HAMP domain-containing methyl-accepting chemotaxis protein [Clostridium sp. BJN0001]|uniref:methyl-accepting chemotaxis protein n=1 Tax=Clostridium sp. BJN0001 TaxID=2930219 RepID=UPI001FD353FC|nr:HAMP domain-containing methyl-accepting chemotaxis protein [Clostridium sp. BJN0001]
MKLRVKLEHFLYGGLEEHSKKVFEGISNGRKKALYNWFDDKWVQVNNIKESLTALQNDKSVINKYLEEVVKKYEDFCEIFVIDTNGKVKVSSCAKHRDSNMSDLENLKKGIEGKKFMYGPYIDERTLDADINEKKFFDEVTLMFSVPYEDEENEKRILCCRALNDDMSNVIQDEDTHIYKNSGDNYLFMVKSNRQIETGAAISRSRFEDNLKEGVKTAKWGEVKVKNHTEFEIVFTDPKTKNLHMGIKNTISNGQNMDVWPGYPDYRHILVGGKGTLINPPNSDEVWGMMCEGDIDEIYDFKGINLYIPLLISSFTGILLILNNLIKKFMDSYNVFSDFITWILISVFCIFICRKFIVSPLNKTVDILQDIAEGEGNLTKRVDKMSKDEIGELSRWFNKFINSQMTMLKRVKKSSKVTKKSVSVVSNISTEIHDAITTVYDTIVSLLENFKNQNSVFQNMKNKFSDISSSIQEMDSLIIEMSQVIQNTNNSSKEANNNAVLSLKSMENLEKIIKNTVSSVTELQKHSDKITKVISTIEDISRQTQMLSLNASIEAARAGESGKGFTVVAKEISKLALETESATNSIRDVINNVQNQTENTCIYADKIDKNVYVSIQGVKDTISLFSDVNNDINMISDSMKSISSVTSKQSSDVNDVLVRVSEEAEKANRVTKDSSKDSKESLKKVKNMLENIKQLKKATNALYYSSDNMEEIVEGFKLK